MSDTPPPPNPPQAPAQANLSSAVASAASKLQSAYFGQFGVPAEHDARSTLARLRSAAGLQPEDDPLAWQLVLDDVLPGFPEHLVGRGDSPSPAEKAAFTALTLFGYHMQSAKKPMHAPGPSFGHAVGKLTLVRDSASIKPRFDAALSVRNEQVCRRHLLGLIALLRTEEIGFDYGWFATNLMQLSGKQRNGVLLRWGRDFATARFRTAKETEPSAS